MYNDAMQSESAAQWEFRAVTRAELERLWEKSIAANPNDGRWAVWRDGAFAGHDRGTMQTFAAIVDGEPVGEGTLMLSQDCPQIGGRAALADGSRVANINGLRIEKRWEGQGHVSRLVREMERDAVRRGISEMTIGVEAVEVRNLAIYLHWGYTRLVLHEIEDGELVLYYAKTLINESSGTD